MTVWNAAWLALGAAGAVLSGAVLSGAVLSGAPQDDDGHYALIGMAVIARDAAPDSLPVGGVSGLDFDSGSGIWYLISDDKSEFGPARMWPARIRFDHGQPPQITLSAAMLLRNDRGATFPPQGTGAEASDAESLRVLPGGKGVLWSSEGDGRDGFGPAVRRMSLKGGVLKGGVLKGGALGRLPLPASFAFDPAGGHGPRPNLSIEGLSFTDHGRKLWISLEAPLYQDGDLAGAQAGALIRLTQVAYPSGRQVRQVAYRVEPIGPFPTGHLADNGVSEILALDAGHMLVLERSGIAGEDHEFHFRTRIYCAALTDATEVGGMVTLRGQKVQAARKVLAIDLSRLSLSGGQTVDNVEGMALGPVLSNGHASLMLVTDNDFSARRQTQLIALEIMARPAAVAQALCRR